MASTWAAMFSASCSARLAPSAWITLATPAILAAACAAPAAFWPAISTWTSPPQAMAAVTVLRVAGLRVPWSCSAMTRLVMSDHLGFVLQLGHQRGHIGHLDAGAALGRLADLERLDARRDVDPEVGRLERLQGLLLGLHDVGQRHVARLVQAQVGGHHRRQLELDGLEAAIDLARHRRKAAVDDDLGGEGGLRQLA